MLRILPALTLLALSAVTAPAGAQAPPAPSPSLAARIAPFLHAREATFQGWMADGAMLVTTRFGATAQLHRVATPLGAREQLTYFDEPVLGAAAPLAAGASRVAFLAPRTGSADAQLFVFGLADRAITPISDGRGAYADPLWSPDARTLVFQGSATDTLHRDIMAFDPGPGAIPRLIVAAGRNNWRPLDWSADGTRLLIANTVAGNELHVAEYATGRIQPIEIGGERARSSDARFAPDGRGVYVVGTFDGEFKQLWYLDPVGNTRRPLTESVPWDIESFAISRDGRHLAYAANVDGTSRLTVLDQVAQNELAPAGLPAGVIDGLAFDAAGQRLGLSATSGDRPRDAFAFDLATRGVARWTQSELGPLDPAMIVAPELVRFPTWDRDNGAARALPAYVYRPRTPGPHPVLVRLSGADQQRPAFDALTQMAVNALGYAVIAPNLRGADGYGRTFVELDSPGSREDVVRDVGSLLVWIGVQRDLDRQRVIVLGEGHGGYAALASLAQFGNRIAAGIDLGGIASFARIPNAKAIRQPLLVVRGANDPLANAFEMERLVTGARANGADVWTLVAKDEGAEFRRQPNRDAQMAAVAVFLERFRGR